MPQLGHRIEVTSTFHSQFGRRTPYKVSFRFKFSNTIIVL